jgi:hypothetical protein
MQTPQNLGLTTVALAIEAFGGGLMPQDNATHCR